MSTLTIDVNSLTESLAEAVHATETGQAQGLCKPCWPAAWADGKIEFPYDAVHVDFLLKAA